MVYNMAHFNFTWGLEIPCWVQGEVPHMESGLVHLCRAFSSFHTNQAASPRLHANIAFTNQDFFFCNLRPEPPGTKKWNKDRETFRDNKKQSEFF